MVTSKGAGIIPALRSRPRPPLTPPPPLKGSFFYPCWLVLTRGRVFFCGGGGGRGMGRPWRCITATPTTQFCQMSWAGVGVQWLWAFQEMESPPRFPPGRRRTFSRRHFDLVHVFHLWLLGNQTRFIEDALGFFLYITHVQFKMYIVQCLAGHLKSHILFVCLIGTSHTKMSVVLCIALMIQIDRFNLPVS
jgi:hypothetical protein